MEPKEFLYETHFDALWNTIKFLGRGMAFYLAINAAVFGYVFTADLDAGTEKAVLLVGVLTSVLFALCSITCIWWCRRMGQTLKLTIEQHAPNQYSTFNVKENFKRGQFLFMTFGACMVVLVLALTLGYVYLLVCR